MTTSPATPHPDDLRLFLTVVRRGGFSAAAAELGLSTAGVSKRVRLLEAQLGATLLHRTTRRIGLTPQGEQLCLRAQPLLDAMDDLVG
ncbi:DNA-binding transcriptional LysR family regulator [Sphaerotilus sulfidivorans]|uniref:DNA-binding transcriptional LysR family regulator n=1 Tax=Sphaerotilus sulfidivorans TaxID=639200 RepID=A0ABV2IR15_9BURK